MRDIFKDTCRQPGVLLKELLSVKYVFHAVCISAVSVFSHAALLTKACVNSSLSRPLGVALQVTMTVWHSKHFSNVTCAMVVHIYIVCAGASLPVPVLV